MKRILFCIGSLIVLVFGGMATINYLVDPGHIYSTDYIDQIIEGVRNGYNVERSSKNMDERLYKAKLAEIHNGEHFDFLAIGSSRVMTVSKDALNGSSLLNLGVSSCKLEDMISYLQICKCNNICFKNIIVSADPPLFNESYGDSRWKSIYNYCDELNGIGKDRGIDWEKIKQLVSPSYFQASFADICDMVIGKNKINYVTSYINDGFTNRTDGSIYYDKKYRDVSQDVIDDRAANKTYASYNNFDSCSRERIELFEKLIAEIKNSDAKLFFLTLPYHPFFYKRVLNMQGAYESIEYINNFSKENDICVIGSFNPDDVGFTKADFYDGGHVKKESIDSLILNSLFYGVK